MNTYLTKSEQETERVAAALAQTIGPGDLLALYGGLGAGKTAFVRGLASGLGIDPVQVSSPTFALVHEYRGDRPGGPVLCHFDMYRVDGWESLYSTGFFDYLDTDAVLAVEWSENIEEMLPERHLKVAIRVVDEHIREIRIGREGKPA